MGNKREYMITDIVLSTLEQFNNKQISIDQARTILVHELKIHCEQLEVLRNGISEMKQIIDRRSYD